MAENGNRRVDARCRQGCQAIARGALTLLVIDASGLVQACLAAEGLRLFGGEELVSPPLLWSEATSVLHELRWRREISEDLTSRALATLLAAPVQRRAPRQLYREAWRIADDLGWARTYDAEYVALARILRCRLFTVDDRLRRGAGRLVGIVGPNDL
jgi:predicted nucleic acid-binding protein